MISFEPQNIGRAFFKNIFFLINIYKFFLSAVKSILDLRKFPVRFVFYKQIYFTGMEALNSVALIGILIGLVFITQIHNTLGFGSEATTVKILIWIIVRELGPLLAAMVILTRSGSAIATELGAMMVEGEIKSLEILGINPMTYLIMPRIVGVTAAVIILTFYFELFTILGGLGIASLWWDLPLIPHIKTFLATITLFETGVSALKSLFFGIIISTISCYQGLNVGHTITQIPQAAAKAVMQSLFLVFIFDGIITLMAFL